MNNQVRKRVTRLIQSFPNTWRWKKGVVLHDLRTASLPSLKGLSPAQLMMGMQPRTMWDGDWKIDDIAEPPSDYQAGTWS